MIYLVACSPSANRTNAGFSQEIRGRFSDSIFLMENVWLIHTSESVTQVYEILRLKIEDSGLLFVSEMLPDAKYAAWLSREQWDWLNRVAQAGGGVGQNMSSAA